MPANTGCLSGATVVLFLVIAAWPASATSWNDANVLVSYPAVTSKTCFDQPTSYTSFTVDMYVTESDFSGLRAYATHWTDDARGWAVRGAETSPRFVRFYLLNGGWTSATCSIGHLQAGEEFRFTASYNADTKETKCFVNGGVDGVPGPEAPVDTKPLERNLEFSGPPTDVQMCVGGSNRVGDNFAFGGIRNFRLLTEALDPEPETSTERWPLVCGPQCRCRRFRDLPDNEKFIVDNRAACQKKALEAGRAYFQYNRKNGKCATFDSCTFDESVCRGKCKKWKVFKQPSRQLAEPESILV